MQVLKTEPDEVPSTLIYVEDGADAGAYELAANLRINGCLTEMYIENGSFSDAESYAEKTNNTCILRVYPDGRLTVYDKERDTEIDTTLNQFMGIEDEIPQKPWEQGFRML